MADTSSPSENPSMDALPTAITDAVSAKPTKPKKSVKFSADSAATDGNSRQRIHNAILGKYASAAIVTPEDLASSFDGPSSSKRKRWTKKKRLRGKAGADADGPKTAALAYLLEYHESRRTWKFQKARQNWILRNAFDVQEIEPTEAIAAALKGYIASLQGQEARDRLVEQGKKILEETEKAGEKKDGEEGFKVGVPNGNATETEEGEREKEEQERLKKMARAKLILSALGHNDDSENEEDGGVAVGRPSGKEVNNGEERESQSDSGDSEDGDSDSEPGT